MHAGYTDVTVLLDRSGSMASIKGDMESGFNALIAAQRPLPGECRVTLVQFDSDAIETVYEHRLVHDVPALVLVPRGSTPLLDAVAKTIDQTGARLGTLPEPDRPERVLCIIITDGQENASRTFTRDDVKRRITHQRETYRWDFIFLGANVDSFAEATSMGIAASAAGDYAPNSAGVKRAYMMASASLTSARSGGSADLQRTPEEQAAFDRRAKRTP